MTKIWIICGDSREYILIDFHNFLTKILIGLLFQGPPGDWGVRESVYRDEYISISHGRLSHTVWSSMHGAPELLLIY